MPEINSDHKIKSLVMNFILLVLSLLFAPTLSTNTSTDGNGNTTTTEPGSGKGKKIFDGDFIIMGDLHP